jgi:hypothetical protein
MGPVSHRHWHRGDDLRRLVASKIMASYIYRLEYRADFNITKFNVIVEVPRREGDMPVRLVAALEYRPTDQVLKLIRYNAVTC